MIIGVPRGIKNHEYRVGLTPDMVGCFVEAGHRVLVEAGAGAKAGFSDQAYLNRGAETVSSAKEVYGRAEMIVKVKEPQEAEYGLLREGQIIYGYLHLAPDPTQTAALLKAGVVGIAYETVTDRFGKLPLLMPMSEIAGRVSVQAGASCLQLANGGRGVLLGGVPGVLPANVIVIGGGVLGTEAARMAMGLGADVTILDTSLPRLKELDNLFGPRLKTAYSSGPMLERLLPNADLVIGAVLIPGQKAPRVITRRMVASMMPGSVIVDASIDQGGCIETARPTSHSEPTYVVDGVVHYCVTNIPAAVARTSTLALGHATLAHALNIANLGWKKALKQDPHLANGMNVCYGKVTHRAVAADLGYEYTAPEMCF